jgi:hypothetical protein
VPNIDNVGVHNPAGQINEKDTKSLHFSVNQVLPYLSSLGTIKHAQPCRKEGEKVMGRPRRINHDAFLRLFDEIGVVKEAARRLGIHEQTAHQILRTSRGQCRDCPTAIPPGQRWCGACRERIRAAEKAQAAEHVRLGLCVKCTERIAFDRSKRYCDAHATALVDYTREYRRKRVVNTTGTTMEAEKALRIRRDYGEGGVTAWQRDGGCCILCGKSYADGAVYLHHIDQDRSNNIAENFVCLCYKCHRLIHGFLEHPNLSRLLAWFHEHYPEERLTTLMPKTRRAKQPSALDGQITLAFTS